MTDQGAFTPANPPKFTLVTPVPKPPSGDSPKRPRGRPPGAKNKPKVPEGGINPPMEIGRGRPTPGPTPPSDETLAAATAAAKKAEKKARAEEYAKYISEEINDKIFMAIVMLSKNNIKPDMFYLPGKAPPHKKPDERLSELGNAVAIPPDMATSWGKLLAELSYTDVGKTATKYAGTNALAILGAAITAIFTSVQYVTSVKGVVDQINKLNEMKNNEPEEESE